MSRSISKKILLVFFFVLSILIYQNTMAEPKVTICFLNKTGKNINWQPINPIDGNFYGPAGKNKPYKIKPNKKAGYCFNQSTTDGHSNGYFSLTYMGKKCVIQSFATAALFYNFGYQVKSGDCSFVSPLNNKSNRNNIFTITLQ